MQFKNSREDAEAKKSLPIKVKTDENPLENVEPF